MNVIEVLRARRGLAGIAIVGLVALVAVVIALASGSANSRAHGRLIANYCPKGSVPADDSEGDGHGPGRPPCVPLGRPETFQDLNTVDTQLESRNTAPFSTIAPGAYGHAYAQRAALAAPKAADESNAWKLAGTPPLCADPTTQNKACAAASAENGQYSYMSALGFRTLTGRISALAYDPSTQEHYFASPVVGGVWESVDGGATWTSIGDNLPTQTIGALAYDAPLHRVIAGSGDNSFGGSGIAGHGIYYSDDDGASWHTAGGIPDLALSFKLVVSPVDPTGKTVYAATSKGLYRSNDGGASYVNENLPTSPKGYSPDCAGNTTSRLCFFANDVTDVIVKPTRTSNAPAGAVIAAVGWRAGQKVDTDANGNPVSGCTMNGAATNCLQAPQNGLYESSTGQPGSFSYIVPNGSPPQGLPATPIFGRTALAVAHGSGQSSDAIYALVEDAQKFNGCLDVLDQPSSACQKTVQAEGLGTILNGMYASYDFGKTWTKIMDFTQLQKQGTNSALLGQPGYQPGVQAWYNLWVEADPTATDSNGDPTRVVFGLEEIWENNQILPATGTGGVLTTPYTFYPGGTSANDPWVVIGRYWNGACGALNAPEPCNNNILQNNPIAGTTTHPDQHAYAMIPDGKGGETLLVGSDGGVFKQHIAKSGDFNNDNWGDGLNATLSALQPYDANMAKDGTVVSGLQDNGEMKIAPDGHEAEIYGGDGFFSTIDPNHSKNILEEYTYATINLTTDGGASWYPIAPGCSGSSSTSLFSTPMEQDPTTPGHILVGCTQIQEATNAYADPCANPDGGSATNCQATNSPFTTVYDLSTLPSPNGAPNIPSALAVRGANEYAGYCGYCDPATQNIPFANGIATNVGGSTPPKIGTSNGWHQAQALCAGCQTANGKLPERYINSIEEDPSDPNTIYLTLGGYERRWIPPGSFGEDVSNVGVGHVFVSHDHGNHFTNITGNLPDISANYTALHNGQLLVATDLGVYIQTAPGSSTYAPLGTGLPMAPVFTLRQSPANPDLFLVSTYGRGDWLYNFAASTPVVNGVGTIKLGGRKCTKPSGKLSGKRLGRLALGETRKRARKTLRLVNVQAFGFDDFCLRGGRGIRVGYPSRKLLRSLRRGLRSKVAGRVVMALTANPFYRLDGIKPGAAVATVSRKLHINPKRFFAVGLNDWYVVPGRAAFGVLKVRRGVIQEIGIADKRLLTSHKADLRFFTSFRRA